jgi:hypothetical protein
MINRRKPNEVVLRISIDEAGKCGLSLGNQPNIGLDDVRLALPEGAFAGRPSRSWTSAETETGAATTDQPHDADMDRFFYKWGGSLASILARLRSRYGGDLDQFLIHLVFMLGELDMMNVAATARTKGAERTVPRACELNMQSLADITGVPRESVRRKLSSLCTAGLVRRTEEGLFAAGPNSDVRGFFFDLGPLLWAGAKTPAYSAQAVHP